MGNRITITDARRVREELNADIRAAVPWYRNGYGEECGPVYIGKAYGGMQVQAAIYGGTGCHAWGGYGSAREWIATAREELPHIRRNILADSVKGIGAGWREESIARNWDGYARREESPAGLVVMTYYADPDKDGHRDGFSVAWDGRRAWICG